MNAENREIGLKGKISELSAIETSLKARICEVQSHSPSLSICLAK